MCELLQQYRGFLPLFLIMKSATLSDFSPFITLSKILQYTRHILTKHLHTFIVCVCSSPHRVTLVVLWYAKYRAGCFCSGWWAGVRAAPPRTNQVYTHRSPTTTRGSRQKQDCPSTHGDWCIPLNETVGKSCLTGLKCGSSSLCSWQMLMLAYSERKCFIVHSAQHVSM